MLLYPCTSRFTRITVPLWQSSFCQLAINTAVGLCVLIPVPGFAQINPDSTLPVPSIVNQQETTFLIEDGTKVGSNLFHSFSQFSVPRGTTAFFNNAASVQNIFSRVTGQEISRIDGIIKANATANLFLINPKGIIFGSTASLNIGGSFVATTASAIAFGDQGLFSATSPNHPPLLTVNPSAFLFNQIAPVSITNQAALQVPNNFSLFLVGGDINLNGGALMASGGRVELGSLLGTGTIELVVQGGDFSLNFPEGERGNVSLDNSAEVNVRANSGGSIAINAGDFDMSEASKLRAGILASSISSSTVAGNITVSTTRSIQLTDNSFISNAVLAGGKGNSGDINITTRQLSLTDGAALTNALFGEGNGGNINIKSDSLFLRNNAQLQTTLFGRGNAGDINIQVQDRISFVGVGSSQGITGAAASVLGVGNGGNINMVADSLLVVNGAQLLTNVRGQGDAGSVNINARNSVVLDGVTSDGFPGGIFSTVRTGAVGNGGNIGITTGSLFVINGSEVSASTFGTGVAGNIQVLASQVFISGVAPKGFSSGLFSSSNEANSGLGGNIEVTTDDLHIKDGAALAARTRSISSGGNITVNANTLTLENAGKIITTAFGIGSAGNINIEASRINISGSDSVLADKLAQLGIPVFSITSLSGIYANTEVNSVGKGGSINIDTGNLSVSDKAGISVSSSGQGNAGSLQLTGTDSIRLDTQAFLSAATVSGEGGNVSLQTGTLQLRRNSSMTATAGSSGNGGNLNLNTQTIVALEDSNITANAFQGRGGNIQIATQGLFQSSDSAINATSQLGINGIVQIKTLGFDPANALTPLNTHLMTTEEAIAGSCLARRNVDRGRFVVTGKGGVSVNPETPIDDNWPLLSKPVTTTSIQSTQFTQVAATQQPIRWKPGDNIVEAQGIVRTTDGRTLLTSVSQPDSLESAKELTCQQPTGNNS